MITDDPELEQFEPGMEIKPFDSKLIEEIFLNHPHKILLIHLDNNPPNSNRWEDKDIIHFYFKMLDDYTRYGIDFQRKFELLPNNNLYVIENKDKNIKYLFHKRIKRKRKIKT